MKKFLIWQAPCVFAKHIHHLSQLDSAQVSPNFSFHDQTKADPSVILLDVYVREDPTFIEGLHFDDATNRLLESSGW